MRIVCVGGSCGRQGERPRRRRLPDPDDGLQPGFMTGQHLADLLFRGVARRVGPGVLSFNGARFTITQVIRVLSRDGGESDRYGLVGTVENTSELRRAGASLNGSTMKLGTASYTIERGVRVALQADAPDTGDEAFALLQRIG